MSDTVEVRNVNHPDYRGRVNAAKYQAMKSAFLTAMADGSALTQAEMKEAAKAHLPHSLFPDGKAAGWWAKTVQLDMEARGEMTRSDTKPLTFSLT